MSGLNALYYPFSRCIDDRALKQFLLVFDSITFIDPVDSDCDREELFVDIEHEHSLYARYRDVSHAMPLLRSEGVVKIHTPERLRSLNDKMTVAATLSDLEDQNWVREADPRKYGIPTQSFLGQPCWNVFKPKLPNEFLEALECSKLRDHVFTNGGDHYAWQLSYAAGSSVGLNVHLAAAEELALAPVTDSLLHHYLLLQKLQRGGGAGLTPASVSRISNAVTQRTIFNIIERILPSDNLNELSIDDVLRFCRESKPMREEFIREVGGVISSELDPERPVLSEALVSKVTSEIVGRAERYGCELKGVRDKFWPKLMGGAMDPGPAVGGAAALAASYITSSGYVLIASIVISALGPLKSIAEWRAESNKARTSDSTAIAYLSRVRGLSK